MSGPRSADGTAPGVIGRVRDELVARGLLDGLPAAGAGLFVPGGVLGLVVAAGLPGGLRGGPPG